MNKTTAAIKSFKGDQERAPQIMWIGRSQLKKMNFFSVSQVRVFLCVIEGEDFTYPYQNDVSARLSRKIEPLFPKKDPYFGLTYD